MSNMTEMEEALGQYDAALRAGQKYHKACVAKGQYPYPQVLNDLYPDNAAAARIQLGLMDIPMDLVVGTTTAGRRTAFAGNFMPLLGEGTEFAAKWISLCKAHVSPRGITDPIQCYEYLGRFYVTEGNKRVSVLKSFGAVTIAANVTRVMPRHSDDEAVKQYYEFLPFFQLSGIYDITFSRLGSYAKLQAALGYEADHEWTKDERIDFRFYFHRFKEAFEKVNRERLELTAGDALLVWLQFNEFSDIRKFDEAELVKNLTALWPQISILASDDPIAVSTMPEEQEKNPISRLLGFGRISHLDIAFIYAFAPDRSRWTVAHEAGRKRLEHTMGDRVTVRCYECDGTEPADVMEQAVAEGAQVIFATTPPMIAACRQIAAKYPQVRVLNCSLSMPYPGVRTYYSRIFEAKFITGVISGAMASEDKIGYVANYPIIGSVTAINAFALGVKMSNPRAKVVLEWTCTPGSPLSKFREQGISVISNREIAAGETHSHWDWGTYRETEDGGFQPLASPKWNWGRFYERVVESIFDGSWDALEKREESRAVNYWWGMNSGVIDVFFSDMLPDGVRHLANILKEGLVAGTFDPFACRLVDQNGNVRYTGEENISPEELMNMDWLLDNVEGHIPQYDELLPVSRQLVRLLGLYRDQIRPEPEEVIL